MSQPGATLKIRSPPQFCGTTPAVLSVTRGALGGTRTPNLLTRSEVPAIQHVRLSPAGSRFRRPGAHRRPGLLAVSSRSGGVCVTDVTTQRPGEDLWPAGPAICLGDHRHACYSSTSDAAHRAQDLRGDPDASCGECCAITPRLLHRCNLSPHSHPQTVLNFPRRYTDLCGHRRACADALLLGWRAQASRGTHTECTADEATDRGPAHGRPSMPLDCLQYCSGYCDTALLQAYGRGSSIFRLERGPAHSKPSHAAVIQ